jgi:hypothetical protein
MSVHQGSKQSSALPPEPTPIGEDVIPSPVVNVNGIAILGGVMVLIVLAAVYREILIHKRTK